MGKEKKKERNMTMYPSVCSAVGATELMEGNFLLADLPEFCKSNSLIFNYLSVIINDKSQQIITRI